ncbi:nucleotidyltransferase family protein, partial [uncultured Thermomonas sp.]
MAHEFAGISSKGMTMDDACMLDWLTAALRGDVRLSALAAIAPDQLIVFAKDQGVLPLLESQLRATGHFASIPLSLQQALIPHVREAVVQDLFRTGEMRKLAPALQVAGIRALLLKGNAVAQWLYPESYLRPSSDIDLLLPDRTDAERAACAAQPLGYALAFHPASSNFEMVARRVVDGVSHSELDLHCRLLNSAAYADIFSFDELWQESIALPALGEGLRGLSPRHALAHACLNRALDM